MKPIRLALLLVAAAVSAGEPADQTNNLGDPAPTMIAPRDCEILREEGVGAAEHYENLFMVTIKSGETLHCMTNGQNGDAQLYLVSLSTVVWKTNEFLGEMNSFPFFFCLVSES